MKLIRTKDVVEIVFDDPATKNSFSLEHAEKWLNEVTSKPTRLMILRAVGSVFCSGGNLSDYAAMTTKAQGTTANKNIRQALEKIDQVPCAKVAFVTGDCFGGGLEVLSVCDSILSVHHAFFGLWQSRMELSFGWGGGERLARRMSRVALTVWLAQGRTHSAYWCKDQGLIDELVTASVLEQRYQSLMATATGEKSRYFSDELFKDEANFFDHLWWSDEHRKRLNKFKP